jgi:hypothetical protein
VVLLALCVTLFSLGCLILVRTWICGTRKRYRREMANLEHCRLGLQLLRRQDAFDFRPAGNLLPRPSLAAPGMVSWHDSWSAESELGGT